MSCRDEATHLPLIGGISIMNGRWFETSAGRKQLVGTLGFFATVNGEGTDPHNVVLVTNNHVLTYPDGNAVQGQVGDEVYQPNVAEDLPNNLVASIQQLGKRDNHPFAYPNEAQANFWVDCAAAKLKIKISSCCHCNCGVSFANRIRLLSAGGSDEIKDVARAKVGDIVFKTGYLTGLTKGRVVSIIKTIPAAGGLPAIENVIEIEPIEPNCDGLMKFSDEGDSGSAIVTEQGNLIGLLFSASFPNQNNRIACHIHPVLDALGVTAITRTNPVHDNPAADGMSANVAAVLDSGQRHADRLRQRLLATPEGRRFADVIERHYTEVVDLVNNRSRVALAWQRNQGPAYLNRVLSNARFPDEPVPRIIDGIRREQLLAAMADVLAAYGSAGLAADLHRYRPNALTWAASPDCDRLDGLVDSIAERQFI
jgi:hypothetical protein